MKKLPFRLGIIFLSLDLVFWVVLLLGSLISPENAADGLTFLPVFWYLPASLIMTSVPLPFLAGASMTTDLMVLALLGSFQHFVFGYFIGLFISFLRKKA
ncbi:hypothetical protein IPG41_01935 [Candidatus Peregrinibacteria bacterium]|nr:MAG: hypothetical protein IPG41_01935 [Candidatus Peregrinibacteria bacterium]